jgi:PilZ domain-containing protein
MDRLREFSIVTVSLPDSARVSEFKAYVVGVQHTVATLQPVERVEPTWLPDTVQDVLMSFAHGTHTVGLKGAVHMGHRPDEVLFRVTDGVCIPRRRASRLKLCAPASLAVDGAEIVCQTHDIGPDGVMLESAGDLRVDQAVAVTVMLPEDPDALVAMGVVTETRDDGLCWLRFSAMEPLTRRRLTAFVTEHFRRRLEIVRSLRTEMERRHDRD